MHFIEFQGCPRPGGIKESGQYSEYHKLFIYFFRINIFFLENFSDGIFRDHMAVYLISILKKGSSKLVAGNNIFARSV